MCRYAWHNYRDHFACFHCRKAFKYWQWEDCDESQWKMRARLEHVPREIVCPDCSRPMVDMGLDFKAPTKDDREAWQILERFTSTASPSTDAAAMPAASFRRDGSARFPHGWRSIGTEAKVNPWPRDLRRKRPTSNPSLQRTGYAGR